MLHGLYRGDPYGSYRGCPHWLHRGSPHGYMYVQRRFSWFCTKEVLINNTEEDHMDDTEEFLMDPYSIYLTLCNYINFRVFKEKNFLFLFVFKHSTVK